MTRLDGRGIVTAALELPPGFRRWECTARSERTPRSEGTPTIVRQAGLGKSWSFSLPPYGIRRRLCLRVGAPDGAWSVVDLTERVVDLAMSPRVGRGSLYRTGLLQTNPERASSRPISRIRRSACRSQSKGRSPGAHPVVPSPVSRCFLEPHVTSRSPSGTRRFDSRRRVRASLTECGYGTVTQTGRVLRVGRGGISVQAPLLNVDRAVAPECC